jgi:bla regulator protein BlaR1
MPRKAQGVLLLMQSSRSRRYGYQPLFFGILVALLLLAGEFSLSAQLLRPKEPMPSFEVATIRPGRPSTVIPPVGAGGPQRVKVAPTGAAAPVSDRVHFIGQIELLIGAAYGLPLSSSARILGGPDWIRNESDRYEVTGKIDDTHYAAIQKMSPAQQQEQVSLMEQSLLADRFKFRAHIETREMPEYALVVAKGGSELERAQDDARSQLSFVQNGRENELRATAVPVEELARSRFLRMDKRQILDRTGLQGRFNFTLKFTVADVGAIGDDSNAPQLPTALQEQLGLKLVPGNGPVEVVVIDHIERPSEN